MADVDVIVVGARIAGATTAALLAERGYRVLLLDRAVFPSDTLSTHFFRAPALRVFRRLGVYDDVALSAPHLTVQYTSIDEHELTDRVQAEDDLTYYLCVRRVLLDDILVRRVRKEPLVDFREGARAVDLLQEHGRAIGVSWTQGGRAFETTARVIVGADGFYSRIARLVQPTTERAEPVNRAMYYSYYAGLEPVEGPAAEFHSSVHVDSLVYVFPCDGGLTLVAVSVPMTQFGAFREAPDVMLERSLYSRRNLAPRLQAATRVSRVLGAGNIPGYMRVPYGPGWALVGDAGLIMDPFSGQGIDQASTHAAQLAEALHAFLGGESSWEDAMAGFHRVRNAFTQETYLRTCTGSRDLRVGARARLKVRGIDV
jgi:2-polyprenyl-6-methoxyphenol hydroxylase-like FAD-dependent oxidoreductase